MTYQLLLSEGAREQLKALPKPSRRRIGLSLTLQTDLDGDVKKLSARDQEYRLRVGSYRVLFRLDRAVIEVYAVRTGRTLMARTVAVPKQKSPTIRQLAAELDELRDRIEDLEDLRDLREAVQSNGRKPLIPSSQIKKELDLG